MNSKQQLQAGATDGLGKSTQCERQLTVAAAQLRSRCSTHTRSPLEIRPPPAETSASAAGAAGPQLLPAAAAAGAGAGGAAAKSPKSSSMLVQHEVPSCLCTHSHCCASLVLQGGGGVHDPGCPGCALSCSARQLDQLECSNVQPAAYFPLFSLTPVQSTRAAGPMLHFSPALTSATPSRCSSLVVVRKPLTRGSAGLRGAKCPLLFPNYSTAEPH